MLIGGGRFTLNMRVPCPAFILGFFAARQESYLGSVTHRLFAHDWARQVKLLLIFHSGLLTFVGLIDLSYY